MTKREFMLRAGFTEDELPPPDPPGLTDEERDRAIMARFVAKFGAPGIEHYRTVYAQAGVDWPGEEEIRRRHFVAAPPGPAA